MKFINVTGFGNTGCTVQADFLCQYKQVIPVLSDLNRNVDVLKSPCQEFGILKCLYSIGGMVLNKTNRLNKTFSKELLKYSLLGQKFPEIESLGIGAQRHLNKRGLLSAELGDGYQLVIDSVLECYPEDYNSLNTDEVIVAAKEMFEAWCNGVSDILKPYEAETPSFLMLKNDPTGAHPLLASFLSEISTAIIS